MSPHPLFADDALSIADTSSTASSGRVRTAVHPLQTMMPAPAFCEREPSVEPLGDSASSAMSLASEHSASASISSSARPRLRSSLSQRAFKVHASSSSSSRKEDRAAAARRVNAGGVSGSSAQWKQLEDTVASLRQALELAHGEISAARAEAERHAALSSRLEKENASLKEELETARRESREHRSLARKVVQDNARLMTEANEREADAARLSKLAEKVRTLAESSAEGTSSRRGSEEIPPARLAIAKDEPLSRLDAVNLSNECESLRRENIRLRREAEEARMKEVAHSSAPSLLSIGDPAAARTWDSQQHGQHRRRPSALKKMASIKKMTTSVLGLNDPPPSGGSTPAKKVAASAASGNDSLSSLSIPEVNQRRLSDHSSPEDFLWDDQ